MIFDEIMPVEVKLADGKKIDFLWSYIDDSEGVIEDLRVRVLILV